MHNSFRDPRAELLAYISNAMSHEQHDAFERRVLDDPDFSDAVALAEQELLEDFASDALTAEERSIVDPWVKSSPRRVGHIRLTYDLLLYTGMQATDDIPDTKAFTPISRRYLPAIALIAACLLMAATFFWKLHPRNVTQLPQQARVQPPATPSVATTVVHEDIILLAVDRTRGALPKPATYTLHPAAPVRVQFMLPASSKPVAYSLELRSGAENSVTRYDNLTLRTTGGMEYLELVLPPDTLRPGSYSALLLSPSGTFSVRFSVAIHSRL